MSRMFLDIGDMPIALKTRKISSQFVSSKMLLLQNYHDCPPMRN